MLYQRSIFMPNDDTEFQENLSKNNGSSELTIEFPLQHPNDIDGIIRQGLAVAKKDNVQKIRIRAAFEMELENPSYSPSK